MSIIADVLLAAHEAGIEDADLALVKLAQLEREEIVTLVAANGEPIHTMIRQHGTPLTWEAPAPFFAVALASLRIEPYEPRAIRLESE